LRAGFHGRRALSGARGFTLIELIVSISIGLIVIGLVTVSINNIRRADLKKSSGMMSSAMRYLYNLAVINNTPYRMVIDMDKGAFWGEAMETDDPCNRYLPAEGEEMGVAEAEGRMGVEGEPGLDGEQVASSSGGYRKQKDNLLSERELPRGIVITGILTSHHRDAQREGRAAIHFFPGGYAERAYVWLGEQASPEEDPEEMVTLDLDGLMGSVKRHNEVLEESSFIRETDG
jgi:general secretion pathway protein H